ncbi:putative importin 11 [Biscogniauxia mediterranea]|nr:putative importin 11 [Biscogniauxia mediterranea]
MTFAIEVPGAASPLSRIELCRTLQSASSHDSSKRQAAGQQLSTWESHQDYYPALQAVFLDNNLPREIRLLAIIQLKNGIDRLWRHHTVQNAIQPDEKHAIRANLFRGTIQERDKQLAFLNALVIAKVIRIDFPQEWPDPLTTLIDLLRQNKDGDQNHLAGALVILLRTVKELGTARLRKSQTALQSATPELVYILAEIYGAKTATWTTFLTGGGGQQEDADAAIEASLLAFKILRRLLLVGYEYPHKDKTVEQVWTFSQSQFGQFLSFVGNDSQAPPPYVEKVGKHLLQFTKLHIGMADEHPGSFASLPNSLDLARAYWDLVANFAELYDKSGGIRQGSASSGDSKSKVEGPLVERLALKGLLLTRACVRMVHYPRQTIRYRSKQDIQEGHQAIEHVKVNLFTDQLVIQMANTIITHLFVFRKADFDAWEEDPQEWEQQEENQGNAFEWEVRPCAEKLFLDLLTQHKHLLMQPLLSYFATAQNPQADVVAKEAVYTAMGLAAAVVESDFDFDAVLKSTIVSDAQNSGHLCQILRRRIAILLSQWVPVKVSKENRPLVYEIFRHFLNPADPSNDIVVRITAARQLKAVVDELEFDGEMFLPFASGVLTELISLLQIVEIDETKLAILETTRSLIQRMETHVSQFGDFVMDALPGIWDSAGELGFMMKQAVLAIMQTLVLSMRMESRRYQHMILPLVAEATQEGSEMYLYLIEEALELWSNILQQSSPPLSPELLALAETAVKLLRDQNEHAFSYTSIVGCYITLAPETMLEDRLRPPLLEALSSTLSAKSREQISLATKYTESLIRLSHELGGIHGFQVIVQDMVKTRFLPNILEGIHDSYEAHQTSGPKKRYSNVSPLTLTDYFAILSRIALIDPATFVEMLASLGPLDLVWNWLSAEWFSSLDSVADHNRQKLNLLGLTRLLELPQPMQNLVLSKLQEYLSMWTSVMVQILDEDNPGHDQLVIAYEVPHTKWDTPKDVRERALWAADPVKTVQSLSFVKERLHNLVQSVGGEQVFQENWAVNVDKEVLEGFQALGTPRNSNEG